MGNWIENHVSSLNINIPTATPKTQENNPVEAIIKGSNDAPPFSFRSDGVIKINDSATKNIKPRYDDFHFFVKITIKDGTIAIYTINKEFV